MYSVCSKLRKRQENQQQQQKVKEKTVKIESIEMKTTMSKIKHAQDGDKGVFYTEEMKDLRT